MTALATPPRGTEPRRAKQRRKGPNRARRAEARLLVWALAIAVGGYVLLSWSQSPQLPSGALGYGGSLAVLALVSHLVVRAVAPHADPVLLPSAFLLNGLGLVLVRRVDFAEGTSLAISQTTWTTVGVAVLCILLLAVPDVRKLTQYHYLFGLATLGLLVLPLLPVIGTEINGARLWVRVAGISFQPGEIAKLTVLVFLAGYLVNKRALLAVATHRVGPLLVPEPRHLAPLAGAAGVSLLLMVSQKDLGTSVLFFGAFVIVLYIGTGRVAYPLIGLVAFAIGAYVAWRVFGHVQVRVSTWLDPWSDIDDTGFQLAQVAFALGTGGVTGTGLGLGQPGDIPFAATDAIFAVLGEELGLLGTTAVVVTFTLLVTRGFRIALTARDEAGQLLAAGLTTVLALQVFVIIGGVTRLVPFTGITLPFVSYGGSALVANYALVALLLRISHTGVEASLPVEQRRGWYRGVGDETRSIPLIGDDR